MALREYILKVDAVMPILCDEAHNCSQEFGMTAHSSNCRWEVLQVSPPVKRQQGFHTLQKEKKGEKGGQKQCKSRYKTHECDKPPITKSDNLPQLNKQREFSHKPWWLDWTLLKKPKANKERYLHSGVCKLIQKEDEVVRNKVHFVL